MKSKTNHLSVLLKHYPKSHGGEHFFEFLQNKATKFAKNPKNVPHFDTSGSGLEVPPYG